ncbi:MAG: GDSL-type esterase/lipase family protein [Mucilaginibacter sp.]
MFWYEDDVKHLEHIRSIIKTEPETIFYGSSTIRLWNSIYDDFSTYQPVNLGFGGSTLAACVWFFERIMKAYQPKRLIVYAGDNDLGDGRHPEEIFIFFQQLVVKANKQFGNISCYFISLKPSPSRWHMADQFKFTNSLVKKEIELYADNWHYIDVFNPMLNDGGYPETEYFTEDGLHMSQNGYNLWTSILKESVKA